MSKGVRSRSYHSPQARRGTEISQYHLADAAFLRQTSSLDTLPVVTAAHRAAEVNLSDPSFWQRPRSERFAAFDLLRRNAPVTWQDRPVAWAPVGERPPNGYWAITSYEGVRAVSRAPATFCSGKGVMLFDNLSSADQQLNDGWVGLDAPAHTELRRLVSSAFTPRVVRRMEEWVRQEAIFLIEAVAPTGECDFLTDVVAPLPIRIIYKMLGVPPGDRDEIIRLTHKGVHFSADVPFEQTLDAIRKVTDYARELAVWRRKEPGDDLISALVQQKGVTDRDVASTFWVLITGGSDTTSTAAAHGLIALSEWPTECSRLTADSGRLVVTAVEEILRWATPVVCFRRTAVRDAEVEGQMINAGDNVVVFYQSANRDEAAFRDPYRFDVARTPNLHFAFGGGGPHFCLGAHLARLQLRILFEELFRRLPDFHQSAPPTYVPGPFLDSVSSVPCAFTPRGSKAPGT